MTNNNKRSNKHIPSLRYRRRCCPCRQRRLRFNWGCRRCPCRRTRGQRKGGWEGNEESERREGWLVERRECAGRSALNNNIYICIMYFFGILLELFRFWIWIFHASSIQPDLMLYTSPTLLQVLKTCRKSYQTSQGILRRENKLMKRMVLSRCKNNRNGRNYHLAEQA